MSEELKYNNSTSNGNTNCMIKTSKTQWLKKELESSTLAYDSAPLNFGERLYRKSLAYDGLKAKEINKIKSKNEKSFHQQCSFKPKTNIDPLSVSSTLSISHMKRFNTLSAFNTHSNKLTTEQAKEQRDIEEIRKYNSRKLPVETIEANSERLFNETKLREKNKADLAGKVFCALYPFTPKVNDTSKPTVHNFFARLQNWVDQKNTKIQEINNSLPIDHVTNQVLFTPIINNYSHNRSEETHEYLYNEHRINDFKRQELKENKNKEIVNQSNMPKVSPNSQKIIERQKEKVFNALFDYINIDNSDIIKYSDSIRDKMMLYFSNIFIREFDTLLNELKESNETLNRLEFVSSMDKLYSGMPLDAKREIMAFNPK